VLQYHTSITYAGPPASAIVEATKPRKTGQPRNNWKRDLERKMWTVDFRFIWRKMETAATEHFLPELLLVFSQH